jgi:hypothetical protein
MIHQPVPFEDVEMTPHSCGCKLHLPRQTINVYTVVLADYRQNIVS